MLPKAYSKKSFGIKNKSWLEVLSLFIAATTLVQDLTFGVEAYLVDIERIKTQEENKIEAGIMLAYFFCFMILQVISFASLSGAVEPKRYKINFVRVWCAITIFTAIYLFNPWIITFKRNAEFIRNFFKYTYTIHTLAIPLHFLASSLVIYIFWRMSQVKPDYDGEEPYEVIYGGQDSETKKSLCS